VASSLGDPTGVVSSSSGPFFARAGLVHGEKMKLRSLEVFC